MQSGWKQTWNTWRSNFGGMKIHRQWKFERKLRKSCGVKVCKLAEYFEVSERIILRIPTWRLFLNFRHVWASSQRAAGCTAWRSTLHLLCSISFLGLRPQFCGISHFAQSLQPHAKTGQRVWPVPITTTQFIIYNPIILLSFDIYHASESHSGSLYNMRRGQRNSWISRIV